MSLYNIPPPYPLQPGASPLFVMLFTQHVGVILLEIENFLKQSKDVYMYIRKCHLIYFEIKIKTKGFFHIMMHHRNE